jgi:uncharacterized RDD family membrane protein YckC
MKAQIINNNSTIIPASFTRRAVAALIDFTIICSLVYLVILIQGNAGGENIAGMYYGFSFMAYNTTLGGKLLRIKTISNGEKLTKARCFLKSFCIFIFLLIGIMYCTIYFVIPPDLVEIEPTIALVVGILLFISFPMIFNKKKKSLIDFLSGTRVIYCGFVEQIEKEVKL